MTKRRGIRLSHLLNQNYLLAQANDSAAADQPPALHSALFRGI